MNGILAMRAARERGSARRAGLGASLLTQAQGTAGTVSSLISTNGGDSTAQAALQSALSHVDPSTLATINGAIGSVNNLGPITHMAGVIAEGGTVSPEMVIGGLAVAATMTMGPVAGAVVAVAGEAVCAIFDALQGPPPPPPPAWNYQGFLRLGQVQGNPDGSYDPIPYGPADPLWISFVDHVAVIDAVQQGIAYLGYPPISGNFSYNTAQILVTCMYIHENWPRMQAWTKAGNMEDESGIASALNYSWPDNNTVAFYSHGSGRHSTWLATASAQSLGNAMYGVWRSLCCTGGSNAKINPYMNVTTTEQEAAQYAEMQKVKVGPADFSVFFSILLARNIEQWVNGHSYIPAYDLLVAAAAAWNATHSNSTSVTYSPDDYFAYEPGAAERYAVQNATPYGGVIAVGTGSFNFVNPVYIALSGWDLGEVDPTQVTVQRRPPLTVNTGALISAASNSSSGNLFGLSNTSLALLGVGAVAAGGVGYGVMTGTLGGIVTAVTSPFVTGLEWIGKGAKRLF